MANRRLSFFLRSFLGSLSILVAAVALAGWVSYRKLNDSYIAKVRGDQDRLARITQESFERLWPLPDAEVDALCKRFLAPPEGAAGVPAGRSREGFAEGARLTVIAADGRVLGDSRFDPHRMENHRTENRPEVIDALGGSPGYDERLSETGNEKYLYLARPVRSRGQVVGAVRVAVPAESIAQTQDFLLHVLESASAAALVTALLVGLILAWTWYLPLRRITRAARRIASGDLESRARLFGGAEFAALGAALNALRENLAQKIGQVTAQRENLQTIVASLDEGVIATDAAGRIVLMNPAASGLLAPEGGDGLGKPLRSVVRLVGVLDAYTRATATGRLVACQVEADLGGRRRTLDVRAGPVAAAGADGPRGLLVLRDVTDLARAAAMKAEFAANASHELRTPLATLRAAVDSLAAADPSDQADFRSLLAILDRHVSRLEHLTRDLLDLHMVESGRTERRVEPITLGALADWTRAQFALAAEEKGVLLDVSAPDPEFSLASDRQLLELILQNLVDNAIKFTPRGGRVDCRLETQEGRARITVADTGCGIRPEDQARVFERFFQTDASRRGDNRVRGTGLGLAIVKHAAERLGARLTLQSEIGKGTTVTVLVPGSP